MLTSVKETQNTSMSELEIIMVFWILQLYQIFYKHALICSKSK